MWWCLVQGAWSVRPMLSLVASAAGLKVWLKFNSMDVLGLSCLLDTDLIRRLDQMEATGPVLLRVCHQVYSKTATVSSKNYVWIIFGWLDTKNYVWEFRDSPFFRPSLPLLHREAWLPGEIAWNILNKATLACPFSHCSHASPLYV